MRQNPKRESKLNSYVFEIINSVIPILRSWYFYLGLISIIAGMQLTFASQTYLYNCTNEGKILPMLPDLILDNLPFYDVSLFYDLSSFIIVIVVIIYIVHKKDYKSIPFFLLMCGIIEIIRSVFIILTPLGNPPLFIGSSTLFNSFSKYDLGEYPSGHVGSAFLLYLMVKNRWYKCIILFCLIIIIISLLLAHAHYSIDILAGFLFAYAINSFGNKYLKMFKLDSKYQFPATDFRPPVT
jgi:membrane-associated phospholipid phosphatase